MEETERDSGSQLVPQDTCIHSELVQSRQNDASMRLRCPACGKTVDFPMASLMRNADDQTQLLRMTFGEAWVKRMTRPDHTGTWTITFGKEAR